MIKNQNETIPYIHTNITWKPTCILSTFYVQGMVWGKTQQWGTYWTRIRHGPTLDSCKRPPPPSHSQAFFVHKNYIRSLLKHQVLGLGPRDRSVGLYSLTSPPHFSPVGHSNHTLKLIWWERQGEAKESKDEAEPTFDDIMAESVSNLMKSRIHRFRMLNEHAEEGW